MGKFLHRVIRWYRSVSYGCLVTHKSIIRHVKRDLINYFVVLCLNNGWPSFCIYTLCSRLYPLISVDPGILQCRRCEFYGATSGSSNSP